MYDKEFGRSTLKYQLYTVFGRDSENKEFDSLYAWVEAMVYTE